MSSAFTAILIAFPVYLAMKGRLGAFLALAKAPAATS